MKKIAIFTTPEMEVIQVSDKNVTSVICTSFNEVVSMTDNLDSDNLDW